MQLARRIEKQEIVHERAIGKDGLGSNAGARFTQVVERQARAIFAALLQIAGFDIELRNSMPLSCVARRHPVG